MNNKLKEALRPVRRRLRGSRVLQGAAWGLLTGAAMALLLLVSARLGMIPGNWILPVSAIAASPVAGMLAAGIRRISDVDAARAADRCGLRERAITALEATGDSPAEALLLEDACRHLQALDARQIQGRPVKKRLTAAAALGSVCILLALLPGGSPRTEPVPAEAVPPLREAARRLEQAAEQEGADISEAERRELRRLARDVSREAGNPRSRESLDKALDDAVNRLEKLRETLAGDALRTLRQALRSAGAGNLAAAAETGSDGETLTEALMEELGNTEAESLRQAAEALEKTAPSAAAQAAGQLQAAADALTAGNPAQAGNALSQMMQSLESGGLTRTSEALNDLRNTAASAGQQGAAGRTGTDSQQGNTAGNAGQNGGENASQPGGGAGSGSTNEDQGSSAHRQTSAASRGKDPRYKEGEYESIYDPTRLNAGDENLLTELRKTEEDGVTAETGPGAGSAEGYVPYDQVIAEYAAGAAEAAESLALTPEQRDWISAYFAELTK